MPSFNFKKQFAGKVKRNQKPGTVRKQRKGMKVGDMMHCFTGMRTSDCQRIVSRKCIAIVPIEVKSRTIPTKPYKLVQGISVKLNGVMLSDRDVDAFAKLDGFKYAYDFFEFFNTQYGRQFKGCWYVWSEKGLIRFGIAKPNAIVPEINTLMA